MSHLFHRAFKMTVYRQPVGGFIGAHPEFFETLDNGLEITELRVQFKIQKSATSEPNHAEVTVTNLNETSRALFDHKPLFCRIEAGYRRDAPGLVAIAGEEPDAAARTIFLGDLIYGDSHRNGTDWETKAQFGDGLRSYAYARANRSYKPGVKVSQVLQDICGGMGMTAPQKALIDPDLEQALATDLSIYGPARDALTDLLAPYGYHWSIQDNQLQVLRDEGHRDDQAVLVKAGLDGTGVIGSPERLPPNSKSSVSPGIKFKMLMCPELIPGVRVKVESERINGVYRVQKVDHSGDTFGTGDSDWTSEAEAAPSP